MLGAVLVSLPVHGCGAFVEDLHAVHAAVALSRLRILAEDQGHGDEAAAVPGPALENGEIQQRELSRLDDLLADTPAHHLRRQGRQFGELGKQFQLVHRTRGGLQVQQGLDPIRNLIHGIDSQGQIHPVVGAKGINEERMV